MTMIIEFFTRLIWYHTTFWPLILVTYVLGFIAISSIYLQYRFTNQVVVGLFIFLWMWVGVVFWVLYYGNFIMQIPPFQIAGMMYMVGALFIIQGALFIYYGLYKRTLSFRFTFDWYFIISIFFIIFALLLYPIIGILTGYPLLTYPIFGIAPCPVFIFTLGLLLQTEKRVPTLLLIIPIIWGIMGIMPVLYLNVWADIMVIVSGLLGSLLIWFRGKHLPENSSEQ